VSTLTDLLAADRNLAGVGDDDRGALASAMTVTDVSGGDVLARESEVGDTLYVVLSGQVAVTSAGRELGRLGEGEWFGLLAVLDDEPRSATVTAVGDIQVASLSRDDYNRLAEQSPGLSVGLQLTLGSQLARDFRRLARHVRDEVARTAEGGIPTQDYDVVVIGGGPMGLCYSMWVKQRRPQTRICVIEKRSSPGFKIGESLLAPALMCFLSVGLNMPTMRRLFNEKFGLHFWWTGEQSTTLEEHINGSEFDETFQVERRVLETALMNVARRSGVHIYRDTRVNVTKESLEGPVKRLHCEGPDGEMVVNASIVCDATGPASVIPRTLGLYTKDVDSFQTNSYFGYFRKKTDADVDGWDVTATRHICIPEGWLWFIELASWEQAPDENLEAMIDHLIDLPEGRDEDYPTRFELAEKFNCPTEQWISIGVVPRADVDTAADLPIDERFQHYVDKYPGLKRIMDNYELVEDSYKGHRRYRGFTKMVHAAKQASGDGWLAVGDAGFFVNPLFSPGMSAGGTVAFAGAMDTIKALDAGDFSAASFSNFERIAQGVFASLLRENEVYYRAYRHPVSYERTWLLKFASQTEQLNRLRMMFEGLDREGGRLEDLAKMGPPPPHGYMDPVVGPVMQQIMEIMREDEAAGIDPGETAEKVKVICDEFIEGVRQKPGFDTFRAGRMMMDYDDQLNRVEGKPYDPPLKTRRCPECTSTILTALTRCPVCGRDRDAEDAPAPA